MPEGVPGLLRDLVHAKTGLYFEDSRLDALMEKLEPLAQEQGHQSLLDYYYALKDNRPDRVGTGLGSPLRPGNLFLA